MKFRSNNNVKVHSSLLWSSILSSIYTHPKFWYTMVSYSKFKYSRESKPQNPVSQYRQKLRLFCTSYRQETEKKERVTFNRCVKAVCTSLVHQARAHYKRFEACATMQNGKGAENPLAENPLAEKGAPSSFRHISDSSAQIWDTELSPDFFICVDALHSFCRSLN